MAESKDMPMQKEELVPLMDAFYEVHEAIRIIENCDEDYSLDPYRNVLLLRVADEKMSYYQKKYNPEVSPEDQFLVEDVIDFARAAFTYKVRAVESAEVGRSHISGQ